MRKVLLFFFLSSAFMIVISAASLDEKKENNKNYIVIKSTDNAAQTRTPVNVSNTVSGTKHTVPKEKKSSESKPQIDPSIKFNKLYVEKVNLNTKRITFDFPNTDLKIFARFVAKLCGKILIGDELLKGKVDIKSQRKMNLAEVEKLFDGILSTYDLECIKTEDCMEIIEISDSYVEVYELEYLKADDLAKALSQMFKMSFRVGNKPINIEISSVEGSNAIMVLAPKSHQIEIKSSIEELDTEVRQVLLDVLIIELTKGGSLGFGMNVNYGDSSFNLKPTGIYPGILASGDPVTPTIGYSYSDINLDIGVNAGEKNTKVKVLSQPRIIAFENQKAQIKVAKKQPYANGSTSENSGVGVSTTTQTTTEEVGVDLTVTPRINKEKDVTLELKLKITSIVDSQQLGIGLDSSGLIVYQSIPIIGHRIVNNTSIVENGKTLALAGLFDNQKVVTTTAPPLLSDIPWVGFLFTKTTEEAVQTELMIYITPTVIDNHEQLRTVTQAEIQKLRNYDPKEKNTIDQLLTGKKMKADDTFKLYDYFSGKKYRQNQSFIPEPENL